MRWETKETPEAWGAVLIKLTNGIYVTGYFAMQSGEGMWLGISYQDRRVKTYIIPRNDIAGWRPILDA
jgi:hypothetical protein